MKKKIIDKFRHSIWSNVIAGIIVLIITAVYNLILSLFKKTNFTTEFYIFWNYEIKLWIVLLLLIFVYIITIFYIKTKKNRKFIYDNETLILDKKLFDNIRSELIDNKVVSNLKSNSFSSHPFDLNEIDFIHSILKENDNPNFEFINPELEFHKQNLIKSIDNLQDTLMENIFGTDIKHQTKSYVAIPKEWNIERYQKAQKEIGENEDKVYENFERLIKLGRRILKI